VREESKCSTRYPWIDEVDPPTNMGILPRLIIDSVVVVVIDRKKGIEKS
jgi:hypothetical protein